MFRGICGNLLPRVPVVSAHARVSPAEWARTLAPRVASGLLSDLRKFQDFNKILFFNVLWFLENRSPLCAGTRRNGEMLAGL